ncbi:MAG: hypothetical protein ABSH39_05180 [Candidatus Acidiferrum sp.]
MPSSESISSLSDRLKDSLEETLVGQAVQISTDIASTTEAVLKITPGNSSAAPIEIVLDREFGAYLTVGRGSVFEIPFVRKRSTAEDFVSEITNLTSGIANGGFQEDVVLSKGKVVGASGTINAGGRLNKPVSDTWMKLGWELLSKRERERHIYQPY